MTRDPVDAAEIEHDLASQKGMDVEEIYERILNECESGENLDWIEKEWAHEVLAQVAWFAFAPGLKISGDTKRGYGQFERLSDTRGPMRVYMKKYARRMAEKEANDPS